LLGPGDFWFVHKVLRRPWAAWITFPLLVVATSAGAYALGGWGKSAGSQRVNQVELVDFDLTTGVARGTYWAAMYSPESRRYDLGLAAQSSDQAAGKQVESLIANWGLAGAGIGGMDARNLELGLTAAGYRYAPDLDALWDVPILTGSTKSFLARSIAQTRLPIEARLSDADGLVVGSIANRSGQALRNARLLYGTWAYRLGNLEVGRELNVDAGRDAIQVKTLVMRSTGVAADRAGGETGQSTFIADRASAEEILNLMMFYEAAGGAAFAQLPNRYQAYCDLSRLLELGRAILVAEADAPGGQLVDSGDGATLRQSGDPTTVVYRFVLPVEKAANR
jgi:hypothetical protein